MAERGITDVQVKETILTVVCWKHIPTMLVAGAIWFWVFLMDSPYTCRLGTIDTVDWLSSLPCMCLNCRNGLTCVNEGHSDGTASADAMLFLRRRGGGAPDYTLPTDFTGNG
jgi:hypothetical protein